MSENSYSYIIEYGNTNFYKNGKVMTSSEVLNELEVKDMVINQFSEENQQLQNTIARLQLINKKLKDKDYTNYKKKIQELQEKNNELRSERDYWKTLVQSLARTNGNVELKDEHLAWKRVDVE